MTDQHSKRDPDRVAAHARHDQPVPPRSAGYSLGLEHKILQLREALWAYPGFPEVMARLEAKAAANDPMDGATQSHDPPVGESVQLKAAGRRDQDIHATASYGVSDGGGRLPHLDRIQSAFGHHDVSGIQAHIGGRAAQASEAIGAQAYATGAHVAFRSAPDLHTAAHEAAHVVQQRQGVHLSGGVGQAGDRYEQHADAVADRVLQGESASELLDSVAGGKLGSQGAAIQLEEDECPNPVSVVVATSTVRKYIREARNAIAAGGRAVELLRDYVEIAASYAAGVMTQEQLAQAGHRELAAALASEKRDALIGQFTSLALCLPSGISALTAAVKAIRSQTMAAALRQARTALATTGGLEGTADLGEVVVNARETAGAAGSQSGFDDAVLRNIQRLDARLSFTEGVLKALILHSIQGQVNILRDSLFAIVPTNFLAVQEAVDSANTCNAYTGAQFDELAAEQAQVIEQLVSVGEVARRFMLFAEGFRLTGASGDLAQSNAGSNPNRDFFDFLTELDIKGATSHLTATITRDVEVSGTTALGMMAFANLTVHRCSFDLMGLEAAAAKAGLEVPETLPASTDGAIPPQPGAVRLDAGVGRTLIQFAGGGVQWRMRFIFEGTPVVIPLFPDSDWYLSGDFLALARSRLASSWGTYPNAHRWHLYDARQGRALVVDTRRHTISAYPDEGGEPPGLNPDEAVAK